MKSNKLVIDKITAAKVRGLELMKEKGLDEWNIIFHEQEATIAETSHHFKTIGFNMNFIIIADKQSFEGVLMHEIAHALLGPGKGHGREFKKLCKEISVDTTFACSKVNMLIEKYIVFCPECNYTGSINKNKDLYCAKCFDNHKIVKFKVKENPLKVVKW